MTFRTFQPSKEKKITFGKILFLLIVLDILVIFSLLILAFLPQNYRMKDVFLSYTFTLNIILASLFIISAIYYIGFRSKKNNVIGQLILKENSITINSEEIFVQDIASIRFIGNDIKGEFRGFVSKGSQNQILITSNIGETFSSFFEQTKENPLRNHQKVLESYHQKGILSHTNYQNILNNTNYY